MNGKREILVYAHWKQFNEPVLMGNLHVTVSKGKEIYSFEYTHDWLKSEYDITLDPDLQFYTGRFFPREGNLNFGVFLDSSPDRWGRLLMERKEAILARSQKTPAKFLHESDFLLGVYDQHRMGALRFKLNREGPFLNDDRELTIPPWTSLRELEEATRRFEENNLSDKESLKWINMLLAPGSSLGGARPKASVLDTKGNLWIAKFPSIADRKDVGGWEKVAHDLAKQSGITVPEADAGKFNSPHHTFLSRRFDRTNKTERIHFASAMTMLGRRDGEGAAEGVSYLHIAEFLMRNSQDINTDLEELWRRIVFNIRIRNTDDHLRNHGFLLGSKGWRLSPAYDMNPNEFGSGLGLNISEKDNSLHPDLATEVAHFFRLTDKKAKLIIDRINDVVSRWRTIAKRLGLSRQEMDRIAQAFE